MHRSLTDPRFPGRSAISCRAPGDAGSSPAFGSQRTPNASAPERPHLPFAEVDPAFRYDVLNGLSIPPRAIPARWLYDRSGAELFEVITRYPSITLPGRARDPVPGGQRDRCPDRARTCGCRIRFRIVRQNFDLARGGQPIGLCTDRYLIDAFGDRYSDSETFPDLGIYPVEGDFTGEFRLPVAIKKMRRLGFFPGSTIGNLWYRPPSICCAAWRRRWARVRCC